MKKAIILLVLLGIAVGCGPVPADVGPSKGNMVRIAPEVKRFIDEEAGVVCWAHNDGNYGTGFSCLPLSETKLDYGRTD